MGFHIMPELWFVAYNLVQSQYRGACYLCGWWSAGTEREDTAQLMLDAHLVTPEHMENDDAGQ